VKYPVALASLPAPCHARYMFSHLLAVNALQHVEAAGFILRGIKGIFLLIGGIIAAILCAVIAASKGRSALLFGVLGFFFSIITLVVILVLPSKKSA